MYLSLYISIYRSIYTYIFWGTFIKIQTDKLPKELTILFFKIQHFVNLLIISYMLQYILIIFTPLLLFNFLQIYAQQV